MRFQATLIGSVENRLICGEIHYKAIIHWKRDRFFRDQRSEQGEREVEPKSGGLLEFTAVPWENDHGRRLPRWPIVL